jgi:hypothetical protein
MRFTVKLMEEEKVFDRDRVNDFICAGMMAAKNSNEAETAVEYACDQIFL